jgi:hypothetical protein
MNSNCTFCKEKEFEYVLFRPKEGDMYHYHSYWAFDNMSTKGNNRMGSLFGGKNMQDILDLIIRMDPNMEILGLYCTKCAKRGLNKYEIFRKFKNDKPFCYFCNKAVYQINEQKHTMLIGFHEILNNDRDNIGKIKAFHRDRVME